MIVGDAIEVLGGLVSAAGGEGDAALDTIKDALAGCVPPAEIVGNSDVRAMVRAGKPITRATLLAWRHRDRDPFPRPIRVLAGGVELWDARDVRAWLERQR